MLFGNASKAIHAQHFIKDKKKIVPTRLQGNYRGSLGEFGNTSYGLFTVASMAQRCATFSHCAAQVTQALSSYLMFICMALNECGIL